MRKVWPRFIMALAIVLVWAPNMTALGAVGAAADVTAKGLSDLEGHWSQGVFSEWVNEGWIKGYPEGTYQPDKAVKRAEFVAMINRAFGLKAHSLELPFKDVKKEHWAYEEIAAAYQAGYFKGANGLASPDRQSTRQEGAVMIAGLLGLDNDADADLSKYKDGETTASWAEPALSTLSAKGIFKGDTNGNIRPADVLTRAQAITVIDAALKDARKQVVYDKPGEYGSLEEKTVIYGGVTVAAAGVTLINMDIHGDLMLAEGIGEGDAYLKRVTVKGTTTVEGGGENSIHVEDSVLVKVIVDKAAGKVRIVATGSTDVKSVVVQSSVKLEEQGSANGKGFNAVELAKGLPANSTVDLAGQFEEVRVLATSIQVNIPSGAVTRLEVAENTGSHKIQLGEAATIVDLVLHAIAELVGKGTIETATLGEGAEGSKFENQPEKVEGPGGTGGNTAPPVVIPGGGGVTPPAADQTTASLSNLQIGGSFSLVQRDTSRNPIGSGFQKNVLEYSTAVGRDITATTVPITVTAESSAASVQASVQYKDQSIARYDLTSGNKTFHVNLPPREDVQVYIQVTSGDHRNMQTYMVSFQYERTVQEAFAVNRNSYSPFISQPADSYYLNTSDVLNEGDIVELYTTAPGAESVPFEKAAISEYRRLYLRIDGDAYQWQNEGQFYIKVKRNDAVIMEGMFQYDLAPVQLISDVNGIRVSMLTVEERTALLGTPGAHAEPYVVNMELDPSQWKGTAVENAKFYTMKQMSSSDLYFTVEAPLASSLKADLNPFYTTVHEIRSTQLYEMFSYGYKTIYDSYVQVVLYDSNYIPLGYFEQALEPEPKHVLPGFTIVHSIQPELNTGDQTPPVIAGNLSSYLIQGDTLKVGVNEYANVYVVPAGTEMVRGAAIHELVGSGEGAGAIYHVEEPTTTLDTSKLAVGDWVVVAVDRAGNLSSAFPITIVDEEDFPLRQANI